MLRTGYCVLAAVAAAWGSGSSAQTYKTSDADAALFGARESATGIRLSPSGTRVSYIAPSPGGGAVAFVANIETGETKPFLNSGKGTEKLRWCSFVTDQRLVCQYTAIVDDAGLLLGFQRVIAVNSDGTGIKQLGQPSSFYDATLRQFDGQIIDWLPGSGGSVLMAREYVAEEGKLGTRMVRTKSGIGVDRVDTLTLKVTPVEGAKHDVDSYMSDGLGKVRLMGMAGVANDQMLTGKTKYYYRLVDSKEWRPLTDYVEEKDFTPLAVDATSNSLYVLKPLNGREALYRIRLVEGLATHPATATNPPWFASVPASPRLCSARPTTSGDHRT